MTLGDDMEVWMSTQVDMDIAERWVIFKENPTTELRNRLVERYLLNHLVVVFLRKVIVSEDSDLSTVRRI